MKEYYKRKSSSLWKALVITFSVIGGLLLIGGLIWFSRRQKNNEQAFAERQQTNSAVCQLADNLLGNNDNFSKLVKNSDGTTKTIKEIEENFFIAAQKSPSNASEALPSEIIDKVWDELRPWIEEALRDLNRSVLEQAKEKARRDLENWIRQAEVEYQRKQAEYLRLIQELNSIRELIAKYQEIREKELLDKITRKSELIAKGYSDRDIEWLRNWNLLDQEIPDLKAERRIGVTNILWIMGEGQNKIGGSSDLIIFLKPNLEERDPRTEINIGGNQKFQKSVVNFSINIEGHHPQKGYWFKEYYEQIIRNFLTEREKSNNDAYVLIRQSGPASGDSAGIAFFLALHSIVNQIPLPRNLGSTGTIESQKTGPIGGLKTKIKSNVEKKKNPIDLFILSEANYNKQGYQNFYNRNGVRTSEPEENWFENFPSRLKEKPKKVEFVKLAAEIPLALERILNPQATKRDFPTPPEPGFEFSAAPEHLLALMLDFSHQPSQSSDLKEIIDILVNYSQFSEAFQVLRNLREELIGKVANFDKIMENQIDDDKVQDAIIQIQRTIESLRSQAAEKRNAAKNSNKVVYIRRFVPVKDDCCGGKCKKKLADVKEEVEQSMKCSNRDCQKEFSRGYSSHSRNEFFCQKCGQENGCSKGEYTVWIEQVKKNENSNQESLIKEAKGLENQSQELEKKLREFINKQKSSESSSEEKEFKKSEIIREYETRFRKISNHLTNLLPSISRHLSNLGFKRVVFSWKNENFGRIHLTTIEPSVNFEIVK